MYSSRGESGDARARQKPNSVIRCDLWLKKNKWPENTRANGMVKRVRSTAARQRRLETRLCIAICTLLRERLGTQAGQELLDNPAPVHRERVVALLRLLAEGLALSAADQTELDDIILDRTDPDGIPHPAGQ